MSGLVPRHLAPGGRNRSTRAHRFGSVAVGVVLACVVVGTAWLTVDVLSAFKGLVPPTTKGGSHTAASAQDTGAADTTGAASPSGGPGTTGTAGTRPGVAATLVARRIDPATSRGRPPVTTVAGAHPGTPPTTRPGDGPDGQHTATTADPGPTTTTSAQPAPLPSTPEPTRPTR